MNPPQATLRLQKIKSWTTLANCAAHNGRTSETPNANENGDVIYLIGSPTQNLVEAAKEKIGHQKIRKNAVLAVELIMGASPQYFRPSEPVAFGTWDETKMEAWKQASLQWLNEKLNSRVLEATLHLDEGTPHIHCLWVPINEQGKLSYRSSEFGGSKHSLSKIQDSYAQALAPIGIERGIKSSKASYQRIQQYYQTVNQSYEELELSKERYFPTPEPQEKASSYRTRTLENFPLETINSGLAHRQWLIKEKDRERAKAINSEKERQKLAARLEELESHQLSVEDVAYELGFDSMSARSPDWKRDKEVIQIVENAWMKPEGRHGSAVELVMERGGYNFNETVAWLAARFGTNQMVGAVMQYASTKAKEIALIESPPEFKLPQVYESHWGRVNAYLTDKLRLPVELVTFLHSQKIIYADPTGAAIFAHRRLQKDSQSASFTGATRLKPTGELQVVPGSFRREGCFWVGMGERQNLQTVAIANTPIEALSLLSLNQFHKNPLYLAVDSPRSLPVAFLKKIPQIVIASTETDFAQQIQQCLPSAKQVHPQAPTWNAQLQKANLTRVIYESQGLS